MVVKDDLDFHLLNLEVKILRFEGSQKFFND
jgi:hypothetical protein